MLLGVIFLFIVIGATAKLFGDGWAFFVLCVLMGVGAWGNWKDKQKATQDEKLPEIDKGKTETKKTIENKITTLKPKSSPKVAKETIQFWYTDFEGNLSHRIVDVKELDDEYLEAYCHEKEDWRTFRVERIDDEIVDINTGEILTKTDWLANHGIYTIKKFYQRNDDFDEDDDLIEICFTGFKQADKARLERLAMENDYIVRKSVTQNLTYLVCGKTAGPAKRSQAERQGVIILDEEEFLALIDE